MRFAVIAMVIAAMSCPLAHAQTYPARPVTVVVPFPPGGIADITARPLAGPMAKALGQNVIIENRTGAGGAVGHAYVARAKADGYTLMMALSSVVIIPESEKVSGREPSYTMSQFAPVALISADPTVLLVRTEAPWQTVGDLIEDAKKRPGRISFSTSGLYGTTHTAMEMLWQAGGVKLLHVPYGGGGPSMAALLGGQVDITAQAPGVASPHVKGGKVRMLGGWGTQRIKAMPDLPTMKEQGFDVEFYIWSGLFAPAGTPADVLSKIRAAVRESVQDAGFRTAMAGMNTPINHLEGAEFESFLEKDSRRLAEVVRRMGKLE